MENYLRSAKLELFVTQQKSISLNQYLQCFEMPPVLDTFLLDFEDFLP